MSIRYEITGQNDAPYLVLLPPLGGSGAPFEPFRRELSRDHRVLTCEVTATGVVRTRELAADVAATLRQLGLTRVDLFGISFGGMIAQWVAIDHAPLLRRLVLASTCSHHPHSREELLRLLGAAARHDTRDRLAEIRCPTLVLTGARDEVVSPELQEELATSIRSALPAYIEDAGHDITLDQPEETARLVREFLESPARSSRAGAQLHFCEGKPAP
jgi:pimeloyl-ACP methyl ester carboxylesterase